MRNCANRRRLSERCARSLSALGLVISLVVAAPGTARAHDCWSPGYGHGEIYCEKGKSGKKHHKKHKKYKKYEKYEHHHDHHEHAHHDGHDRGYEPEPRYDDRQRAGTGGGGAVSAGGLAGAAAGGYLGSKVGKGNGKLAATAAGAVGGYILGAQIERDLEVYGP